LITPLVKPLLGLGIGEFPPMLNLNEMLTDLTVVATKATKNNTYMNTLQSSITRDVFGVTSTVNKRYYLFTNDPLVEGDVFPTDMNDFDIVEEKYTKDGVERTSTKLFPKG